VREFEERHAPRWVKSGLSVGSGLLFTVAQELRAVHLPRFRRELDRDSVDAMLSDRPYRDALSMADVRGELRRCAGTQFDPELVRVVLSNNTLERAELMASRSGARTRPKIAVS
jgi:hypothetical protein